MLLRACSLRPGAQVRSYSIFLLGGLVLFAGAAALVPIGAARALWDGAVAEAILMSTMGLLMVAGAYAFAKASRNAVIVCRREGAQLRITTAKGPLELAAGEVGIYVRKVEPRHQHWPHHEVRLRLPQYREPVALCESVLAGRARRHAERLAAHLELALIPEPEVDLRPAAWIRRE